MNTGLITAQDRLNERTRLSEFALLLASLNIDTSEFAFISHEAQGGYQTDIEAIRTLTARFSKREDRVIAAYLPSMKNYFPDTFFVEQLEESDHHPGVIEDKYLEFWSAFDTITYRFWIQFHIHALKMLFCIEDSEVELLYWDRFGGDVPSLTREDRRFLLLLRMFAPFFRGRRLLYERVLPAFLKKPVTVEENTYSETEVPEEYRCQLGRANSCLGRDFYPGEKFSENFSSFGIDIHELDMDDIDKFAPHGPARAVVNNLNVLFAPAHLKSTVKYNFKAGLSPFVLGNETRTAYLGFSTHLRETV